MVDITNRGKAYQEIILNSNHERVMKYAELDMTCSMSMSPSTVSRHATHFWWEVQQSNQDLEIPQVPTLLCPL